MRNIIIRPSVKSDIYEFFPNLQEKDKDEITALGFTPRGGVYYSYRQGLYRKTALLDGKIAAMFGVAGVPLGIIGQPYFLSGTALRDCPVSKLVSIYREEVSIMLQIFPVLENFVDARYKEAIRLLKLSGFTISDPQPVGKNHELFCKFRIEAK